MMAAGRAAQAGKKVLLIEKNKRLGEKLRITGGGRCNITNAEPDQHALLAHYGDAADFLYSPFSQLGVAATRTFFDNLGVPTVEQGGRRVFPRSELAEDVAEALERHIRAVGVTIRLGTAVQEILVDTAAGSGATAGAIPSTFGPGRPMIPLHLLLRRQPLHTHSPRAMPAAMVAPPFVFCSGVFLKAKAFTLTPPHRSRYATKNWSPAGPSAIGSSMVSVSSMPILRRPT
jgi:hypothetical protein